MSSNGVNHIESQRLEDAAKLLDSGIKEYINIMKEISDATNDLTSSWYGEGKKEFEKDYTTIYQQLTDVSDIMYDLYDALVNAAAAYVQADEDIAKHMSMTKEE